MFYSSLVGPSLPNADTKMPGTPVALSFRYAKEKKGGRIAVVPGVSRASASLEDTPWESSTLSLSLSECTVVYVQPLWLEAIDFLWEGVLGSAVWGGGVKGRVADQIPSKTGKLATVDSRNQAGGAAEEQEEDGASSSFGEDCRPVRDSEVFVVAFCLLCFSAGGPSLAPPHPKQNPKT